MLYVYHGNDIQRRRQAIEKIKKQLKEKRPEAETFSFDADEFSRERLTELTSGRGLFEDKYIVFLYHVLTIEEGEDAVSMHIERMAEAEHVFVLIEDDLSDSHEDTLIDYARSIKHLSKETENNEQKPWPLADAYGNRDSKTGWLELQKALNSSNNTPESIHGLLWWQTRMMWLAKKTDSAQEAGESSYPYKKAKGFAKNFTNEQLYAKTKQLVAMNHEAHTGEYDLAQALEQFMLEV